ncbi:unnamed protein product [Amoebophrya sp. A25]|nr:unnamed protein product [Amoebophrya sp. A25]|eukprot:GSA25T00007154001.1
MSTSSCSSTWKLLAGLGTRAGHLLVRRLLLYCQFIYACAALGASLDQHTRHEDKFLSKRHPADRHSPSKGAEGLGGKGVDHHHDHLHLHDHHLHGDHHHSKGREKGKGVDQQHHPHHHHWHAHHADHHGHTSIVDLHHDHHAHHLHTSREDVTSTTGVEDHHELHDHVDHYNYLHNNIHDSDLQDIHDHAKEHLQQPHVHELHLGESENKHKSSTSLLGASSILPGRGGHDQDSYYYAEEEEDSSADVDSPQDLLEDYLRQHHDQHHQQGEQEEDPFSTAPPGYLTASEEQAAARLEEEDEHGGLRPEELVGTYFSSRSSAGTTTGDHRDLDVVHVDGDLPIFGGSTHHDQGHDLHPVVEEEVELSLWSQIWSSIFPPAVQEAQLLPDPPNGKQVQPHQAHHHDVDDDDDDGKKMTGAGEQDHVDRKHKAGGASSGHVVRQTGGHAQVDLHPEPVDDEHKAKDGPAHAQHQHHAQHRAQAGVKDHKDEALLVHEDVAPKQVQGILEDVHERDLPDQDQEPAVVPSPTRPSPQPKAKPFIPYEDHHPRHKQLAAMLFGDEAQQHLLFDDHGVADLSPEEKEYRRQHVQKHVYGRGLEETGAAITAADESKHNNYKSAKVAAAAASKGEDAPALGAKNEISTTQIVKLHELLQAELEKFQKNDEKAAEGAAGVTSFLEPHPQRPIGGASVSPVGSASTSFLNRRVEVEASPEGSVEDLDLSHENDELADSDESEVLEQEAESFL